MSEKAADLLEQLDKIKANFEATTKSIDELMVIDNVVGTFALTGLQRVQDALEKNGFETKKQQLVYTVRNEIQNFKNIRKDKSLKPHYEIMLNQCVVLLVSHFASAIEDIFQCCLKYKIKENDFTTLDDEKIEMTIGDLKQYDFKILDRIGEIFTSEKDISFQDMK